MKALKIGYRSLDSRKWWNNWAERFVIKPDYLKITPIYTYANIHWHSQLLLFAKAGHCRKEGISHSQPQRYCVCNCKQAFHIHSSHTRLHGHCICIYKAETGFRKTIYSLSSSSLVFPHKQRLTHYQRDCRTGMFPPEERSCYSASFLIKRTERITLVLSMIAHTKPRLQLL